MNDPGYATDDDEVDAMPIQCLEKRLRSKRFLRIVVHGLLRALATDHSPALAHQVRKIQTSFDPLLGTELEVPPI
jgi:hypothetical protein